MTPPILTSIKHTKAEVSQVAVVLILLTIFLPACITLADEEPATETEHVVGKAEEDIKLYKRFTSPQDAEMDHFVGAIDENLFIGIAVSPQAVQNEEPRTLAVYLCDGQTVSQWIIEEITGQEATLTVGDTSVDVIISDNSVSGTVALRDGESQPFTAGLVTGEAGLYRAEWNLAGIDYQIDWIVLADGRQRGGLDGKGNDVYPPPKIVN